MADAGQDTTADALALSDEDFALLSRWMDGEVSGPERARVEQRLSAELQLGAALRALESQDERLRAAFRHRDDVPATVVQKLLAADATGAPAAARESQVVAFPRRGEHRQPAAHTANRWPLAAAASLLAALGVVFLAQQAPEDGVRLATSDTTLAEALDVRPSGTDWLPLEDGRMLQPVLSFAHRDGTWCREYLLRDAQHDWRGVACRSNGTWTTQALGREDYLDSTNAYRTASAGDSQPVALFITENAADIALGREQEQALINTGWDSVQP
jgi:hypothetical protein